MGFFFGAYYVIALGVPGHYSAREAIILIKKKKHQIDKNKRQHLVSFEGFSKNGYHHVFQRIFLRRLHWTKLILVRFLKSHDFDL